MVGEAVTTYLGMLLDTSSARSYARLIHLRSNNLQQVKRIIKSSCRESLRLLMFPIIRRIALLYRCRSSSSRRRASASAEYAAPGSCCSAPWCSAAARPERGAFPVPDYGALSTTPAERSWRVSAHERFRSRRGQSAAHADEPR